MASTAQSSHVPASPAQTGPELDNRRIAAAAIDLAAPALALLAVMAGGLLTPAVALVLVGWTLYYFFALESGDGQTLGKRAMRLRVVSTDGRAPTMRQYASRNSVRLLDLPVVGLIAMIASGDSRQRLGDRAAGTMVVDAEAPTTEADPMAEALPRKPAPSAPSPAPKPARSRPSLGGPEIKMPKLPSFGRSRSPKADPVSAVADAEPKPKRSRPSLGGPEIKMPSFGRKKKPPVDPAPAGAAAAAIQSPSAVARAAGPGPEPVPDSKSIPAAEPVPDSESIPALKPFDPFAADAPSPTIEVLRPEDELKPDSEETLPEAQLPDDHEVPDIQVVRDRDRDPEPPPRRVPAIPAIPDPPADQPLTPAASAQVPEEPASAKSGEAPAVPEPPVVMSDAVRDDGSPRLNVKPIETISPLELLMQEAEERDRPSGDSSL